MNRKQREVKYSFFLFIVFIFDYCFCQADLVVRKNGENQLIAESSKLEDKFSISTKDLGRLSHPVYNYEDSFSNVIRFTANSDMRSISLSFFGSCKVPIVSMSYDSFPVIESENHQMKIIADKFGLDRYNALNKGEMIIFKDFRSDAVFEEEGVGKQNLVFNEFKDSPMMVCVACLGFETGKEKKFGFVLELNAKTSEPLEESFDLSSFNNIDMKTFFEMKFILSANTQRKIFFNNVLDYTDMEFSHFSNLFLNINLIYTDDDGETFNIEYSRDNKEAFQNLRTDNLIVEVSNKTSGVEAEFIITMNTSYKTILGLRVHTFFILLSLIIIIIASVIITLLLKCRTKKKIRNIKQSAKEKAKSKKSLKKQKQKNKGIEKVRRSSKLKFTEVENNISTNDLEKIGRDDILLFMGQDEKNKTYENFYKKERSNIDVVNMANNEPLKEGKLNQPQTNNISGKVKKSKKEEKKQKSKKDKENKEDEENNKRNE